jgi:flagellar hook-associated protein FlgK
METKFEKEIEHIKSIIDEKYEKLVSDKTCIDEKIHELQKDINQGRSKTPRTELLDKQDVCRSDIRQLVKTFISERDTLQSKLTRLEDMKHKHDEDIRLGKESIEYNLENIQKYVERGNTNEVFLAIESIKNALVIINNKLNE